MRQIDREAASRISPSVCGGNASRHQSNAENGGIRKRAHRAFLQKSFLSALKGGLSP
jgi:hypothetical protein